MYQEERKGAMTVFRQWKWQWQWNESLKNKKIVINAV